MESMPVKPGRTGNLDKLESASDDALHPEFTQPQPPAAGITPQARDDNDT
ncbi:hypothetical protein ABH944_003759 [Caballeronia udeis]|jgi:hypothetical protein|uniref:Uncharacterized protein n=1 Tax=Caballeronia udeis TaxID=1232866 RepID=A0ABW8MI89_9BURK